MEQNHIKSVFQNGTITKEEYTRVWIDLVNKLEANKTVVVPPRT